jgi:hypothetical protein
MTEIQDPIAARYGRSPKQAKRNRHAIAIVAGVLGLLFIIWAFYANTTSLGPTITTTAYEVIDDSHVSVSYEVTDQGEAGGICVLKALRADFGIVGYKEITIPKNVYSLTGKVVLLTSEPAVTGVADSCSVR